MFICVEGGAELYIVTGFAVPFKPNSEMCVLVNSGNLIVPRMMRGYRRSPLGAVSATMSILVSRHVRAPLVIAAWLFARR